METTQLYIELIVIGLETFGWMSLFLIDIIGNEIISIFDNILENFSTSLLLIGILYIIGILMDRLADMMFQKGENSVRENSGLKAKSSFLVWKNFGAEKYADYARSKIRILRASILNIPLITMSSIWYIIEFFDKLYMVVVYVLIIGIFFTYIAWKSYNLSLKRYYDKACALEISGKEKQ